MVNFDQRIFIRVSGDVKEKADKIAQEYGTTMSEWIRSKIVSEYEEIIKKEASKN